MASALKQAHFTCLKRDKSPAASFSNPAPISEENNSCRNHFCFGIWQRPELVQVRLHLGSDLLPRGGMMATEVFQPTCRNDAAHGSGISPRARPSSSRPSGLPPSAAQAQPPGLATKDDLLESSSAERDWVSWGTTG